jgi:hypothetical protein
VCAYPALHSRNAKTWHEKQKGVVGRIGQPEDIAKLVSFFASPAASFITGKHRCQASGIIHPHPQRGGRRSSGNISGLLFTCDYAKLSQVAINGGTGHFD